MTIAELVSDSHGRAKRKGWYEQHRCFGQLIALVHSELSEALEAYRDGESVATIEGDKPAGVPIELADAVIRIADVCGYYGIDLEEAIRVKAAYNETRPVRHGGKAL